MGVSNEVTFQVGSFKYRVFRNSIGILIWCREGSEETTTVDWTLDGDEESPRFREKLREAIGKLNMSTLKEGDWHP